MFMEHAKLGCKFITRALPSFPRPRLQHNNQQERLCGGHWQPLRASREPFWHSSDGGGHLRRENGRLPRRVSLAPKWR